MEQCQKCERYYETGANAMACEMIDWTCQHKKRLALLSAVILFALFIRWALIWGGAIDEKTTIDSSTISHNDNVPTKPMNAGD